MNGGINSCSVYIYINFTIINKSLYKVNIMNAFTPFISF
nr:MAG TPA: hypothetical protein [Bacteriophage sp.]